MCKIKIFFVKKFLQKKKRKNFAKNITFSKRTRKQAANKIKKNYKKINFFYTNLLSLPRFFYQKIKKIFFKNQR